MTDEEIRKWAVDEKKKGACLSIDELVNFRESMEYNKDLMKKLADI